MGFKKNTIKLTQEDDYKTIVQQLNDISRDKNCKVKTSLLLCEPNIKRGKQTFQILYLLLKMTQQEVKNKLSVL